MNYEKRSRWYSAEYNFSGDREFLESLINPSVKSIMEIPAGSGRNIWLAKQCNHVVFVDREPMMVKQITDKLHDLSLQSMAVVSNLETLALDQEFDLILVPHDAFLLLTQEADARMGLERLREHLKPRGHIVIDIALLQPITGNAETLPRCYDPALPDGVWVQDLFCPLGLEQELVRQRRQRHTFNRLVIDYNYSISEGGVETEKQHVQIELRRYTAKEFYSLTESVDLVISECYGDYQRTPFNPEMNRMISVLVKAP